MRAVGGDIREIALTDSNSYSQLGIPRIPSSRQCRWPRLGFCCKGKVSLASPLPPPKKIPTHCGLGVLSKLLLQNVNLSGVNVRDRESTVTNLPPRERNSPTCRVTESLCISQGHGGWRLHQRGNQQSRGLGDRQSRGLPCWRPSH